MASWRQSNVMAGVAVAVILLSLVLILRQACPSNGGDNRDEAYPFPVWCMNCNKGQIIEIKAGPGEEAYKFPKTCPVCNQAKCYPLYYCQKDGTAFPDQKETWNWEVPVLCPDCKQPALPVDHIGRVGELGLKDYFNLTDAQKEQINQANVSPPTQ
jgi:hypothetical protein